MEKKARFSIQSMTRHQNVIAFTWLDIGGTYMVYRDGQLVYEGTVPSFTDGMVEEGVQYDYSIECIEDGEIEVIRVQTVAPSTTQTARNPLTSASFTTIVQAHSIVLLWEEFEGVQAYDIYRNNVLVAEVNGNRYIDHPILDDQTYTYRIQWHRSLAKSEKNFRSGRLMASNFLFMTERKKALQEAIERFTFVKKIAPLQQLLLSTEDRRYHQTTNKSVFTLRYTTFIADSVIKHAHILSKHRYFQGDHRQFHPEGKTYRTRVDVMYNLTDQKQPITCMRSVGQTVSFNRFKKVQKKGFANLEDIVVNKCSSTEKGFQLIHSVHNPIVFAPRIDYEVDAFIDEEGVYDVCGWHDEAPHHEVYVAFDQEKWEPIHLAESKGLLWLADLMGVHYWRFSNFG